MARQAIARPVLPNYAFQPHLEDPHLWLTLPSGWHRPAFIEHVRSLGLVLTPSDPFAIQLPAPNALRIGLGAAQTQAALRSALQSVATALQNEAPPGMSDIV